MSRQDSIRAHTSCPRVSIRAVFKDPIGESAQSFSGQNRSGETRLVPTGGAGSRFGENASPAPPLIRPIEIFYGMPMRPPPQRDKSRGSRKLAVGSSSAFSTRGGCRRANNPLAMRIL